VSALAPPLVDAAYVLFENAYAGTDRQRFERDLREKQRVILLHDRHTRVLKGFSTVQIQRLDRPRRATVIFSGDTVIDREYWGQKQLQSAFTKILVGEKLRAPTRRVYWFLISKGYRTYMLLANAFPRAVPRCDRVDDPELRSVLQTLALSRFGPAFDAERGVVRANGHERVRDGIAPITRHHLANPHVAFFVARNPGHALGDELACLADVRLMDIARITARLAAARMRRRASNPGADARVTLPQAEGA
jgi:hypothetical protein